MKKISFFLSFFLFGMGIISLAQVAVNNDASLPDASAMLDIKSDSKGLLIPRVALSGITDATTIPSPVTSLMIYNTATSGLIPNNVTPGYYYWNGIEWTRLSIDPGAPPTAWSFTGNSGTVPGINFIGTTDNNDFDIRTNNSLKARITAKGAIETYNTGHSVYLGEGAGVNDDASEKQNVFVGYLAGFQNSSGGGNTVTGSNAFKSNLTGALNVASGLAALPNNTTGYANTALGYLTLVNNTTGHDNTAIGVHGEVASGELTNSTVIGANAFVSQSNSLILGSIAGVNDATASVNVGIGTSTPSAKLDVIGQVKITDGTEGLNKVLTSDANGLASWVIPGAPPAAWSFTGNLGTVPGTNFIGTIDNNAFDIRTNNSLKARITAKGAIETYNTGHSVYLGEGAGVNDDASEKQNVFVGYLAGFQNSSGGGNTVTGSNAFKSNLTGVFNVASGLAALPNNTTGNANTALGYLTLVNNTTGHDNTAIGVHGEVASGELTNSTVIGANAFVSQSNSLILGSIAGVNNATASVNVGIGTSTPSAKLDVIGQVKITDGTEGLNKVLTSDANGLANWQTTVGDNLGNHTATTTLNLNNFPITNISTLGFYPPANDPSPTITSRIVPTGQGASNEKSELILFHGNDGDQTSGPDQITLRAPALSFQTYLDNNVTSISNNNGYHERMYITPGGYVGIGTTAPKAPLHVALATSTSPFSNSGTTTQYSTMTPAIVTPNQTGYLVGVNALVSLIAEGDIVGKGTLTIANNLYYSDARVKNITGISNSSADLALIEDIKITDYTMKDKVTWGNSRYKKVIAQDVEKVYPQAVHTTTGFLPDVYDFAAKVEKTETGYLLTMTKPMTCAKSNKVRLELENKGTVEADIRKVLNDYQFEATTETDLTTGTLFVYGMQVNDFRTVDYDAISMLNVSATQELAKQLKEAQNKIDTLEKENKDVKVENVALSNMLKNMKTQIDVINGRLSITSQSGSITK